jgi:hypothetical protein
MKNVANYILLVTSLVITLLFVEIGFRIVAYRNDLKTLENIRKISKAPSPGAKVTLGQIIQLSNNPRIIYEFTPHVSVVLSYPRLKKNIPVTINADGFRGESFQFDKKPQSIRIVGIGDSNMFGWGVIEEETYLYILSENLNSNYSEYSWEIINAAVPGYNTVMEVETLKEKGLKYKPDIVIIHHCKNDFDLPYFIREQEDYFALNQSFMVKYFKQTLKSIKMIKAPFNYSRGFGREHNPQKVPRQYRNIVGMNAYVKAMEELQTLSIKYKFDVIVLLYRPGKSIKHINAQLGFHVLDFTSLWQRYAAEQNFLDAKAAWKMQDNDPHPSTIAHKFIGETLSKKIVQLILSGSKSGIGSL